MKEITKNTEGIYMTKEKLPVGNVEGSLTASDVVKILIKKGVITEADLV